MAFCCADVAVVLSRRHSTYQMNQDAAAAADTLRSYRNTASGHAGSAHPTKRHSLATSSPFTVSKPVPMTGIGSPVPFTGMPMPVSPIAPPGDWVSGAMAMASAAATPSTAAGQARRSDDCDSEGVLLPAPSGWHACGPLGITSKVKVSMLEVRGNRVYDMLRRSHGYVSAASMPVSESCVRCVCATARLLSHDNNFSSR